MTYLREKNPFLYLTIKSYYHFTPLQLDYSQVINHPYLLNQEVKEFSFFVPKLSLVMGKKIANSVHIPLIIMKTLFVL